MLRAGMKRGSVRRVGALAACALALCVGLPAGRALAQSPANARADLSHVLELINQQEQRLNVQQRQLAAQQRQLSAQRRLIQRQRREIEALNRDGALSEADLATQTGGGLPTSSLSFHPLDPDSPVVTNRSSAPIYTLVDATSGGGDTSVASTTPSAPVGQAPPAQPRAQVEALPEGSTALLGHGRLTIEPSLEYAHLSSNRLVFRGVEIITGIEIGLIEASNTARDTLTGAFDARYALTDRLEVEARVPYVYRHDRVTTLAQNNNTVTQTFTLSGGDLGDVELSARYQLNRPQHGGPIYVVGGRIKSTTGRGPFDVARDNAGVETELATGSGFWGAQASLSVLYPTDPVVLYGNISYLYNVAEHVDKQIGNVHVYGVDPGDSVGVSFGMGFALNPRFSYSLGYSHNYIMPTESNLNGTHQRSTELQVGALQFGMSFRATEHLTLATNVDVGVTEDAPDVRVAFRTPFTF